MLTPLTPMINVHIAHIARVDDRHAARLAPALPEGWPLARDRTSHALSDHGAAPTWKTDDIGGATEKAEERRT
ncbi:hypothetical protein ACFQ7A_22415 [Streptomyces sp. NPDC056528]|uniref:hypothetical protein n=1 Tax=Streptomyces sp. NPDC056528 TaxID=3345854 RepID=UPI0036748A11